MSEMTKKLHESVENLTTTLDEAVAAHPRVARLGAVVAMTDGRSRCRSYDDRTIDGILDVAEAAGAVPENYDRATYRGAYRVARALSLIPPREMAVRTAAILSSTAAANESSEE